MEQNALLKFLNEEMPNSENEAFVKIDRKSGKQVGVKVTHKANQALRVIHDKFLDFLYSYGIHEKKNFPFAFAWVSGTSEPVNQALLFHKRKDTGFFPQYWFVTDIKDAYESVDISQLAVILSMFMRGQVLHYELKPILEKFCQGMNGGLARGYSTSPLLFNIYAGELIDRALFLMALRYGCNFCRLGDDIIITSKDPIGRRKRKRFLGIIREAGFTISVKKTRYINLKVQKTFKIFNVNIRNTLLGATILPSKTTERKMKGMLFVERNNPEMDLIDQYNLRNKIHGWNGFCKIPEGITRKRYLKITEGYTKLKEKIKKEKGGLRQGK
jgi:hypothetical protein